jgi:hypothetical protein
MTCQLISLYPAIIRQDFKSHLKILLVKKHGSRQYFATFHWVSHGGLSNWLHNVEIKNSFTVLTFKARLISGCATMKVILEIT